MGLFSERVGTVCTLSLAMEGRFVCWCGGGGDWWGDGVGVGGWKAGSYVGLSLVGGRGGGVGVGRKVRMLVCRWWLVGGGGGRGYVYMKSERGRAERLKGVGVCGVGEKEGVCVGWGGGGGTFNVHKARRNRGRVDR